MGFQTTGTASEYFAVDASKVTPIPEDMSYEEGAMIEPCLLYTSQMKMNFQAKTSLQKKDFTVTKAAKLDYGVGDTVRHVKFGVGIVKNIVEGGRDYEVTVDFDKVGVKKMFAGFAKLKKI